MSTLSFTRDWICTASAGRDLDRLVAIYVMGQAWQGGNPIPNYEDFSGVTWPPPYSIDVAMAWKALEKFRGKGVRVEEVDGDWRCCIGYSPASRFCDDPPDPESWDHEAEAETVPLAICRAALLTVLCK